MARGANVLGRLLAAFSRIDSQAEDLKSHDGGLDVVASQVSGLVVAQPEWTLSLTAGYINGGNLSNTARGIRVTFKRGTTTGVDTGIMLCLNPDTDAIRDSWFTATLPGQRINIPMSDRPFEMMFNADVSKIGIIAYGGTLGGAAVAVELLI